jgi:hypothetical protein
MRGDPPAVVQFPITKVALWLRHFQRIGMDKACVTIEAHLVELARARELALMLGQAAAAVQAEHYRGKAVGLYEDRLRVSASISDVELVKAIDNLLGAEIANAIVTQLAVEEEGRREYGRRFTPKTDISSMSAKCQKWGLS